MKNFVVPGKTMPHVATAAITSGQMVIVGDLSGVAYTDAAIGETVSLALEGVFELPCAAADWDQGDPVYFNATSGLATSTNTDQFVGYAFEAATSSEIVTTILTRKGAI